MGARMVPPPERFVQDERSVRGERGKLRWGEGQPLSSAFTAAATLPPSACPAALAFAIFMT
ncbi:hypothetical protein SAMN04487819_104286 [Actinopolyspora alba]|uniref:Uncharacterized protein n=1 Tax=Actinopolyspora alba TaxID=673379 RepID=A0A1I1VXD6_9ACTN|nr:hypothetical protein SAMN04487819_104286 [Actinopolyspora alba]